MGFKYQSMLPTMTTFSVIDYLGKPWKLLKSMPTNTSQNELNSYERLR